MANSRVILGRLRTVALALPEAHEALAWGEPTFRVKNKLFAMYASAANHHGFGRPSVWLKSTPDNQELMIRARPDRFFKPPYVGTSGWVGVYLDKRPNWREIAALLTDGWRLTAPKKLVAAHPRGRRSLTADLRSRSAGTPRHSGC